MLQPDRNPKNSPQLLLFKQPQEGKTFLQLSSAGATSSAHLRPEHGAKSTWDICNEKQGEQSLCILHETQDKEVKIQSSHKNFLLTLLLFCSPKFEGTG